MEFPNRKRNRLKGYDYSTQNYYYVTVCTHNKKPLFGEPDRLNEYGKIAEKDLLDISKHFDGVKIDQYVIMPNHIHAIIVIGCDGNVRERSRPFPTLPTIMGLYKSGVSRQIHEKDKSVKVWQKSYYDEIISADPHYLNIWQYIESNPFK